MPDSQTTEQELINKAQGELEEAKKVLPALQLEASDQTKFLNLIATTEDILKDPDKGEEERLKLLNKELQLLAEEKNKELQLLAEKQKKPLELNAQINNDHSDNEATGGFSQNSAGKNKTLNMPQLNMSCGSLAEAAYAVASNIFTLCKWLKEYQEFLSKNNQGNNSLSGDGYDRSSPGSNKAVTIGNQPPKP